MKQPWILSNLFGFRTNKESGKNAENTRETTTDGDVDEDEMVLHYTVLIIVQFLFMIVRTGTFFVMCITASINLHNRIFFRLMRTPIAFFDNNPTGKCGGFYSQTDS